jgi:hypothetical protein
MAVLRVLLAQQDQPVTGLDHQWHAPARLIPRRDRPLAQRVRLDTLVLVQVHDRLPARILSIQL